MKKLLCLVLFLSCLKMFSQNIEMKIIDYARKFEGKEYSTYHFVNSSSSYSRPTIILVTNKDVFMKIHQKIPLLYPAKQEYTDVLLLGIKDFDLKNITETDNKILDLFYQEITKYRNDNDLPKYDLKSLTEFITTEEDLCKYFSCRSLQKKKKK